MKPSAWQSRLGFGWRTVLLFCVCIFLVRGHVLAGNEAGSDRVIDLPERLIIDRDLSEGADIFRILPPNYAPQASNAPEENKVEKTVGEPEMEYARIFLEKHDLKFVHSTMNVVSQILADICSIWGFKEEGISLSKAIAEGVNDAIVVLVFSLAKLYVPIPFVGAWYPLLPWTKGYVLLASEALSDLKIASSSERRLLCRLGDVLTGQMLREHLSPSAADWLPASGIFCPRCVGAEVQQSFDAVSSKDSDESELASGGSSTSVGTSEEHDGAIVCDEDCVPISKVFYDKCVVTVSAFYKPRVMIRDEVESKTEYSIAYVSALSVPYVQSLLLGAALVLNASSLTQSRPFHYLIGLAIGMLFSILVAVYLLYSQTKTAARVIPGHSLLTGGTTIAIWAFPTAGILLFHSYVYHLFSWAMSILWALWSSESLFGIAHLGKMYFLGWGVIGLFLVWWQQWFAPAEPKSELSEDPEVQYTLTQRMLWLVLMGCGIWLLMESTASDELSLLITACLCLRGNISFLLLWAKLWWNFQDPAKYHNLLSEEQFKLQSKLTTQRELRKLRESIQADPKLLERVKESNEIRLRRFANGQAHIHAEEIEKNDADASRQKSCVIV